MVQDRIDIPQHPADDGEFHAMQLNCPVVSTGRLLLLRPPHPDDVEDMVKLADNYRVAGMLGTMPHPYFAEDAIRDSSTGRGSHRQMGAFTRSPRQTPDPSWNLWPARGSCPL
ncbi:MAG: hypothetical protein R3D29_13420 [Nitratireductor sp.]